MATKSAVIRLSLPAANCLRLLEETGNELGYKAKEQNSSGIKWKVGGFFSTVSYDLETSLVPLNQTETEITVTSYAFGIADTTGILGAGVRKFLEPFNAKASDIIALQEGLQCPKCGKQVAQGTLFCPDDGTAIAKKCSNCGNINTPSTQFCTSCGTKL